MRPYYTSPGEYERNWPILHIDEARKLGYEPYSFPCARISEGYIIQGMIDDIVRYGRDKFCVVRFPGSMVALWVIPNATIIDQIPYIHVELEVGDEFE
jgi:hypothetical protein